MKYSRVLWTAAASVAMVGGVTVPSSATVATPAPDPAASATTDPGAPPTDCAWSGTVGADGWNVAYPEGNANYWIQPYPVSADITVQVDGTYPDARYLQMATYQEQGGWFTTDDGVDSWLTDYELEPDEGSANPFTEEGAAPGGSFSVTLSRDVEPGEANTLPMAPEDTADGATGYLIYRVYAPAGNDFSAVDLPEVSLVRDGVSTTLPQCAEEDIPEAVPNEILDLIGDGLTDGWTTEFSRQEVAGLFPNADTGYVERTYDPSPNGDVLVVRGKAPVHTTGNSPVVWPADDVDTRFWSICTGLTDVPYETVTNEQEDGTTEHGCASDDDTELDEDGYYTYVIGTEDQRDQIEQVPGATFLPLAADQTSAEHAVILRNMLPAADFEESVLNVPTGSDPAATEEIMGDYYPESGTCQLNKLEKKGAEACL
jgi:hypothetical protein